MCLLVYIAYRVHLCNQITCLRGNHIPGQLKYLWERRAVRIHSGSMIAPQGQKGPWKSWKESFQGHTVIRNDGLWHKRTRLLVTQEEFSSCDTRRLFFLWRKSMFPAAHEDTFLVEQQKWPCACTPWQPPLVPVMQGDFALRRLLQTPPPPARNHWTTAP